jgi:hypothetical protein
MRRSTAYFVVSVVVLSVASVGYATAEGSNDAGRSAWAQVDPNGGSPLLVRASGFVSVTSPSTGVYCLRASPGVGLSHTAPVASQEQSLSSTLGLVTVRRSGIPNVNCAADELQVTTWDAANPASFTTVNTVGFDVIVP